MTTAVGSLMRWIIRLTFLSCLGGTLWAEEVTSDPQGSASEVSVLCYHDFSDELSATAMRIRADVFAEQMQQLAELEVNVISLSEFLAWKKGELELPPYNVLITIDDGWRSVYEVAFPVLKKHQFPFALGLYTSFLSGKGRSLSGEMLQEMRENGMEVSGHSATHPLPSVVKAAREKGREEYLKFLDKEMGQSKKKLEERFETPVTSYIYPGGFYFQDMGEILAEHGVTHAFTVKPGKVTQESLDYELPRYVVLGTSPRMFEAAVKFTSGDKKVTPRVGFPVKPAQDSTTPERLPTIGIDFTSLENLDPESVVMRVSGFGKVKGSFVPETSRYEWRPTRLLRQPSYSVTVQWRWKGKASYEDPVGWDFYVDLPAVYQEKSLPSR